MATSQDFVNWVCSDQLRPDFLKYLLLAEGEDIRRFASGSVHLTIYFPEVKAFHICCPPVTEQRRIVAILDEAFESIATARANAERNLQNARGIRTSAVRMHLSAGGQGWQRTTIGDQVQLQRGFDITKEQQRPGTIPVVSSGGVKSRHDTAMVRAPGVVLGRKGTLGTVYYLAEDFWPHDTTLWVKDFNGNDARFVYYFFTELDVKRLNSGAANPALNRNQVHPIAVNWPPIRIQQRIAAVLDEVSADARRLESLYQKKLAALDELKQSLLDRAFSGLL